MRKAFLMLSGVLAFMVLSSGTGLCKTTITNIEFSPASPSAFSFSKQIDVTFDYKTDEAGGVRIFPRPMTNNSTTPSYAASGSPLYSTGSGTGSGYFTITSGETTIDHVRFQVYNANQSALLFEFHVPVQYQFPIAFSSVPVAPNISVLVSGTKANVSWAPVSNADGYIFVYAPYGSVDYIATIDVGNKTNFAVNLFWGNVAYYTAVRAYNKNGVSPFSNVEHFIVP